MFKHLSAIAIGLLFCQVVYSQEVLKVGLEPYSKEIERVGKLDFFRTYQYSFKSGGALQQLTVDVGETFTKGKLLATVDTDDLTAELNQLQADKVYVNQEVKRLSALSKIDAVSASELEHYKAQSSRLKAGIVRVKQYLQASSIRAPYDGVVISRNVDEGEWIAPGQTIVEVAPLENNYVIKVDLTEDEVAVLHQNKSIKINGYDEQEILLAKVKTVSSVPQPATGLFEVQLELETPYSANIGKQYKVRLETEQSFVFKVPVEYANLAFNQTATVKVMNSDNIAELRRFNVLGADLEFLYIKASDITELSLVK